MKPILFSTPMVQAILAGRKTQTRRLVKFPDDFDGREVYKNGQFGVKYSREDGTLYRHYPKYQPGDILYVRETWQVVRYAPPGSSQLQDLYVFKADTTDVGEYEITKWKPSLFMPKAAARIFLKVTDVTAERLQDITLKDAIAEGIECIHESDVKVYRNYLLKEKLGSTNPVNSFSSLWNSINAKTSPWKKNDWVWVYKFEKIEKL
jgi:hypothetical protein